ncbi:glutaredoxin 3 [Brucellaceae bacterium C25G]
MVDVTIYTRPGCPYCTKAKALLTEKKVVFNEINAGATPELREEMQQRSGRNTFPQIFIGDHHIGGCDDLHALESQGRLDAYLESGVL